MTCWDHLRQQCLSLLKQKMTVGIVCTAIYYHFYNKTTPKIILCILIGLILSNASARFIEQITIHNKLSIYTKKKLIIYSNQKNIITTLPFLLRACFRLCFLLHTISFIGLASSYHSLVFLVKGVLILLVSILILSILFGLFHLTDSTPIAVLSKKGVWLKEYNFIPWACINTVDTYRIPTTPMETIRIDVLDTTTIYQQANFSGKVRMFWANLFGYPPVIISNVSATSNEVILFAQEQLASGK